MLLVYINHLSYPKFEVFLVVVSSMPKSFNLRICIRTMKISSVMSYWVVSFWSSFSVQFVSELSFGLPESLSSSFSTIPSIIYHNHHRLFSRLYYYGDAHLYELDDLMSETKDLKVFSLISQDFNGSAPWTTVFRRTVGLRTIIVWKVGRGWENKKRVSATGIWGETVCLYRGSWRGKR